MEDIVARPKSPMANVITILHPNTARVVITLSEDDSYKQLDCNDAGEKPPFTLQQLIAMAIMSSAAKALYLSEIVDWNLENFRYHAALYPDCDCYLRLGYSTCDNPIDEDIDRELSRLYAPFKYAANEGYSIIPGEEHDTIHNTVRSHEFPILRLPLELRIMVYKFALTFPCEGGRWTVRRIHQFSGQVNGRSVPAANPTEILALLSVSRQIYEEAVGIFYSENSFEFHSLSVLWSFLSGIGKKRRKFLRNLALDYCSYYQEQFSRDKRFAPNIFKLFKEEMTLRSLHIKIDEVIILHRNKKFKGPQSFPGFGNLIRVRGIKELTFEGRFDETKKYLEARLMEPKKGN